MQKCANILIFATVGQTVLEKKFLKEKKIMLFKVKVPTSISLTPSISLIGTYTVYGIRDEDEKGKKVTEFLIYDEGKWKWESAWQFEPLDE